jgi:hypothetical protein
LNENQLRIRWCPIGPQGVLATPTVAALATVFTPTTESLRSREFGRNFYVNVDSINAAIERVEAGGGWIIRGQDP